MGPGSAVHRLGASETRVNVLVALYRVWGYETDGQLEFLYRFCYIAKMRWTFRTLNALVDEEVRSLPPDMLARFLRYGDIIEQAGLEALPRDGVKHLEGKLWELRITGRDGISRAIYVTASGRRVVVVRVFVKKTQKTPQRELDIARQRAKEVEWPR
jgi:phage-related protein